MLDDALTVDENGLYVRKRVGVLVARQNGKSHLMRMRLLAGMFLHGEKWVSMAQNRQLAWDQFNEAVELVLRTPWLKAEVKKLSRTNGNEYLELTNGAKWSIKAASKDGARGSTANLWVDELREISPEAWKAATPITRAVRNSQIWITSNAGDDYSLVLNEMQDRALNKPSKTVGWYEWSADPALAISNRLAWRQANPSLGILIDYDAIETAAASDTPQSFRTETLCLRVNNLTSPWPIDALQNCEDKTLTLTPGAPTWFAVDVTPQRLRADLVGAQLMEDGNVAIGLLTSWVSDTAIDEMVIAQEIGKWARTYRPRVVAFDRWTGAAIAQRLAAAGLPVGDVSGASFVQACDQTLSAMNSGRLRHAGQPDLTAHFNACVKKPAADGGWRVVRKQSNSDISAAVAAIMCIHHALAPERQAVIVSA
ncbi:MAG: terminase TerL endonuclease subunit [Fluviibacter sp.]